MVKKIKKAQGAAGASALIALIAGFILLYMLMIPPDMREELLNDDVGTNGAKLPDGTYVKYNKNVFTESPGRIDYMKQKDYDHNIPAMNLFTTISAKENLVAQNTYVKNSIFDKVSKTASFNFDELENVDNVYMSFNLNHNRNNKGVLTISINGVEVYNKEPNGLVSEPIKISSSILKKQNDVVISVSEVGFEFWRTNEYEIEKMIVYFDEKDISKQASRSSFIVSETEKYNLDKVTFEFYPDCNIKDVGALKVSINSFGVFSAIPDCGQLNKMDILPSYLSSGSNTIDFDSKGGKYYISNIVIKTKMKAMTYPVYYFDLDDELFTITDSNKETDKDCGEIDGYCPSNCEIDKDKDCCLQESSNYWCDLKPVNEDDRCRSVISADQCNLCTTGYEDDSNNPPELCDGKCGDDTDNKCLSGCSKFYDEDCCFQESENNYWCDDVPQWGASYTCRNSIERTDCDDCASGYTTKSGTYSCPEVVAELDDTAKLKPYYDVTMTIKFAEGETRKSAKFFVNGYQFYMDVTKDQYVRKINGYVEDGSNAIKIEPDTTLDIRSISVDVKNR